MFGKLAQGYKVIAFLLLNTIVCFVVCNLSLVPIYNLVDSVRADQQAIDQVGSLTYDQAKLNQVYPYWDIDERNLMLSETWSRPFDCAPFVHFREAPYTGKYVNVHPAGFRQNSTTAPAWRPDENTINIFLFGGSTTFGYGVADFETIPAFMEIQLNEDKPARAVHVYNLGQGSFYSAQELILFERLLTEGIVPSVAIFIDGLNDASNGTGLPYQWSKFNCSQADPLDNDQQLQLPVARLLDSVRYRLFNQPKVDDGIDSSVPSVPKDEIIRRYFSSVQLIRAVGQAYDVDTLFVWQPIPYYHYDLSAHLFYDEQPNDASIVYELMAQQASVWSAWDDFIYLADLQQNNSQLVYVDRVHYTAAFNAEVASAIVDVLRRNDLLN